MRISRVRSYQAVTRIRLSHIFSRGILVTRIGFSHAIRSQAKTGSRGITYYGRTTKDISTRGRWETSRLWSSISALSLTMLTQQSTSRGNKEGMSLRQESPTRLSAELTLKARTQMSRLRTIKTLGEEILSNLPRTSPLADVNTLLSQPDELHKAFQKEHAYFGVTWPEAFLDHDYFASDTHQLEAQYVVSARLGFNRLNQELTSSTSHQDTSQE